MKTGRPGKVVMCVNDGLVFRSMEEAAQQYNTTRSTISRNIHGTRRTARGLQFVLITGTESHEELLELRRAIVREQFKEVIK